MLFLSKPFYLAHLTNKGNTMKKRNSRTASRSKVANSHMKRKLYDLASKLAGKLGARPGTAHISYSSDEYDHQPMQISIYIDMEKNNKVAVIEYDFVEDEHESYYVALNGKPLTQRVSGDVEELVYDIPLKLLKRAGF